jgi:hypothetical protein
MESLQFIAGPVANIVNRKYPLRFGVVPIVGEEDGRLFFFRDCWLDLVLTLCGGRNAHGEVILLPHTPLWKEEDVGVHSTGM